MEIDAARLREHVAQLARAPRPAESDELDRCRGYVTEHLKDAGWLVEQHRFASVSDYGERLGGVNLLARHRDHAETGGFRFVVAAHLDSLPDTPGADDNASAVAALLEIARCLPAAWPANPRLHLDLLVTDLEEYGMLGAAEHVRVVQRNGIDLRGMVSLEMLGYCDHSPQSQALPKQLVGLYPEVGNFIAIIGNQNSVELVDAFREGMEKVSELPVESLVVSHNGEYLQATRLSDHSPFWDAGYPALMITDTSFLRNPHYHTPGDTPETLDYEFLHRVSQGCLEAIHRIIE